MYMRNKITNVNIVRELFTITVVTNFSLYREVHVCTNGPANETSYGWHFYGRQTVT